MSFTANEDRSRSPCIPPKERRALDWFVENTSQKTRAFRALESLRIWIAHVSSDRMRDGWRWIGRLWGSYASSLQETMARGASALLLLLAMAFFLPWLSKRHCDHHRRVQQTPPKLALLEAVEQIWTVGSRAHGHWPVDGEAWRKGGWVGDLVVPWLFSPFLHFFCYLVIKFGRSTAPTLDSWPVL
jgi:hypothetical protein